MLSSSIFSQTTSTVNKYPKTTVLNNTDTVICFTIPQARELAKIVVTKENQDTVIKTMQTKDSLCQATVVNQQQQITNLKTEVNNMKTIDTLRTNQISDLEKVSKLQEKEIKKEKRKRKLVVAGAVATEVLTVVLFLLL